MPWSGGSRARGLLGCALCWKLPIVSSLIKSCEKDLTACSGNRSDRIDSTKEYAGRSQSVQSTALPRNLAGVAVLPSMGSAVFMVLCDLSAARIHQRCERAGRFAERVGVLGVRS